jgi:hypothetical protein
MHDTVWFEIQGLPSVTIASSEFHEAAIVQRDALGMADARFVLVDHPIQDATDEEMRLKARGVADAVLAALTD